MTKAFRPCCLSIHDHLLAGLRAISAGNVGMALALDDEGKLVGTLVDGDVRRALLSGATLDSPLAPHCRRAFTHVGVEAGRAEVLDLMQARSIHQIPILDKQGRPVGIHLIKEIIGKYERPNWAIIMAGGRGTRLYPITENVPKPMIKVAGRPILERLVLHLTGYGIQKIFLSVNYLSHIIEDHFGDGAEFGCSIEYLREDVPLGTGGSLGLLPEKPHSPMLVMNGDLVTEVNVDSLLNYHEDTQSTATMVTKRYYHSVPYGCVLQDDQRIVGFEEKPTLIRHINAGIYVLEPHLLDRIPKGELFGLPTLFSECLKRGETVRSFELEDDWIDVGQHKELKQARHGKVTPEQFTVINLKTQNAS